MKHISRFLILCLVCVSANSYGRIMHESDSDSYSSAKSSERWGAAPSVAAPQLSSSSSSATTQNVEGLKKKFIFDPVLAVNPNRGTLSSQISIPLFVNAMGLHSLDLIYQHTNQINLGLGIGWSWDLPFIQYQRDFNSSSKFSTVGSLGAMDLVETDEGIGAFVKGIEEVGHQIGLSVQDSKFTVFRPLVESAGTVFVRIENRNLLRWVALSLNGQRWVFDDQGRPLYLLNQAFQKLNFIWDQSLLTGILDPQTQNSLTIQYLGSVAQIPRYFQGEWRQFPIGIQKIIFSNQAQKREVLFNYDKKNLTPEGGLLVSVFWSQGVLPLWQGSYQSFQSIQKPLEREIPSIDSDKSELVFKEDLEKLAVVEKNKNYTYVDIDGDGREDRVEFSQDLVEKSLQDVLGGLFYGSFKEGKMKLTLDHAGLTQRVHDSVFSQQKIRIYKAYLKYGSSSVEYIYDASLTDSLQNLKPISFDVAHFFAPPIRDYLDHGSGDGEDYRKYLREVAKIKVTPIMSGMHFLDLGGQSGKALLVCQGVRELALPTQVVGLDSKKSISSTMLSIAKIFNPALQFTAANVETLPGQKARLFIQVQNQESLQEQWLQEGQFRADLKSNTLINSTKWKEISANGVECHQETLILEVSPGQTALWTGGQLTILGSIVNDKLNYYNLAMGLKEIVTSEVISQDDLLHEKLALVPTGRGRLSLVKAQSTSFFSQEGILTVQRSVSPYEVQFYPRYPILTKAPSPFGGEIEIKYAQEKGELVVKSKTFKPLGQQPEVSHKYFYNSPLRDKFRNTFIGFHAVQETIESSAKNFSSRLIDRMYFQDNLDSVVLFKQRLSRLNGLLYKEQVRSADGKVTLSSVQRKYTIYNIQGDRIFPNIEEEVKLTSNPNGDSGQLISHSYHPLAYWEQSEKKEPLFPLTSSERVEGTGLQSVHTDKMLDFVSEKMQFRRVNPFYKMEEYKVTVRGKDNNQASEDLIREFNTYGDVASECRGVRCQYFNYDSVGRVIGQSSSKGDHQTQSYVNLSPLVAQSNSQGLTQSFQYDMLMGELLETVNGYGVRTTSHFTEDGILLLQTQQSESGLQELFKLTTNLPACAQQNSSYCKQPQKIDYTEKNIQKTLYLDGLGRVENQSQILNGQSFFSGPVLYGIDNQIYSKYQSGFDNKSSIEYEITKIDELGRALTQTQVNGDNLFNQYTHNCEIKSLNGTVLSKSCKNSAGFLSSVFSDGQGYQFNTDELGQVNFISGIEAKYQWSSFGELLYTSGVDHHFWSTELRQFDPQGLKIKYQMPMLDISLNAYGQVLSTRYLSIDGNNRVDEDFAYEKDRLMSIQSLFGEAQKRYIRNINYNDEGQLTYMEGFGLKSLYGYDKQGRISSIEESGVNHKKTLSVKYQDSEVQSIGSDFEILRRGDVFREVQLARVLNKIQRENTYKPNSTQLQSIEYKNLDGAVVWTESYDYNNIHQTTLRKMQSALDPLNTQQFNYNKTTNALNVSALSPEVQKSILVEDGYMKEVQDLSIEFQSNLLSAVDTHQMFYDGFGKFRGACQNRKECLLKIDEDHYSWKQGILSITRVDGAPVVFSYMGQEYPVITDKIGSVRGLFSTDGRTLLFTRNYGAYGEKEVKINTALSPQVQAQSKVLEQLVIWGYAGMIELPWRLGEFSEARLYFSQSRAYSPDARSWLSPDNYVKWDPQSAINTPWDLNPLRYARNQPLDYVDPSGRFAHLPAALTLGAIIGGTAGGLSAYYSGARDMALLRSTIIGAASGAISVAGLGGTMGGVVFGGLTNLILQISNGKSFSQIDWSSVSISAGAAGLGSVAGTFAKNYFGLTYVIKSESIYHIDFQHFSDSVVSTVIGGTTGSSVDFLGNYLLESARTNRTHLNTNFELKGDCN